MAGPAEFATSPELVLAMLADARLPTGAHTQSAGLEPALLEGLRIEDIPGFAAVRLDTVVATDAGSAVVARHRCLETKPGTCVTELAGRLAEVDEAWAARTPSPTLRAAGRTLGRGYARLASRLWPEAPAVRALGLLDQPARGLVIGCVAASTGLDAARTVRLCGYEDVQTVASAALKLVPMDPVDATRWVLDLHPAIEALVARVAGITDLDLIPAFGAPLIEHDAETHSRRNTRLFHV